MKHACTCRRCHRPMEIEDQSDGAVSIEVLKKFAVCDGCAARPISRFAATKRPDREYNSPYKD